MPLKVYINTDTQDLPRGSSGVEFVEMSLVNDSLIFSNGSNVVADGLVIPGEIALTQAAAIIDIVDVIVPKYFLADASAVILKEIHNAGNQNKIYVFCFSFDAATASEPILELWDNTAMNTVFLYSLGGDNVSVEDPDDSWWRGIVTTDGTAPGFNWVGNKLAGATDGHFLRLNKGNGALIVAKDLYCQLKIVIPANFAYAAAEHPIFSIKFTTN
ncbi:MAG: hypothetical protein V1901_03835 [Patescibacteria group bacterium]